jgi:hypothetical protein
MTMDRDLMGDGLTIRRPPEGGTAVDLMLKGERLYTWHTSARLEDAETMSLTGLQIRAPFTLTEA